MKIHGPDPTGRLKELLERLRAEEEPRARGAGEAPEPADSKGSSDRVELSPRARELRLMGQRLEQEPEVRRALVDALREEIRSGRYAPDGRAIAGALLREAGEDATS
jgi:flagellar biosynthesis anti-sigma factor FlgM